MRDLRILAGLALLACGAASAFARPFDVDDLVRLARVSDPQVSPDGRLVAYTLRETDLEGDRGVNGVWLATGDGSAGPVRLTTRFFNASAPRWAPDGSAIYFLSDRSGAMQVWRLPLDGGEASQVTDLPLPVRLFVLSPAGDQIVVGLSVFPDCEELECTVSRLEARGRERASGVLHERLFVRHWDTWKDGRRDQLFIAALGPDQSAAAPRRLTLGLDADIPTRPFGGAEQLAFSPDGEYLVFTARLAADGEPWSTNTDLWRVATRVPGAAAENLTADNPAADTVPVHSPDGRYLAWLAMRRPGFEADRNRIMLRDLRSGATREVAAGWDRSAEGLAFSADGRTLYITAFDLGHRRLFAIAVRSGRVTDLSGDGTVSGFSAAAGVIAFARENLASPAQLFARNGRGRERALTDHNAARLAEVEFGDFQQFRFAGAGGATVYGWVVKPVGHQEGRRYPVAFVVHGGPQGSMGNSFHYRWNPQTYAGKGYAVVFIDFHGSKGYGQNFTDSISTDWGGKPLEDLQKGWAAAQAAFPFLDGRRACALGASYGGYMINWIAGVWPDAFACLVNHSGVFDLRSMYYTTEELWFPEWEMGGPQFDDPAAYERHNPLNLVDRWRTPMLVVHGANDFRVPLAQGLAAFTALQRRGVPSRLLYFPDENHWILKPANSVQWHRVVEDWLARWTAPGD